MTLIACGVQWLSHSNCGTFGDCMDLYNINSLWPKTPFDDIHLGQHRHEMLFDCTRPLPEPILIYLQWVLWDSHEKNVRRVSGANESTMNSIHSISLFPYSDVIISAIASQTTRVSIVYSTVCAGADQRKHQSSASLAFERRIHGWPVNSPNKGPVTRKMFPFDDVIKPYTYGTPTWSSLCMH